MDGYLALAFILIGFGVVLLAAEFFLPTGGVLVVVGVGLIAAAVGVILYYGSTTEAVAAVIAACVGLPIAANLLLYAWQRMSRQVGLDSETVTATVANTREAAELEQYRGRYGRTVSPMRPSGTVEIDGRRLDALTEGMMLDADVWVKCVGTKAGWVVVRRVDPPAGLSDMSLDELN
jgi:membrane-bound serine protease (ClpP class)